MTGLFSDNLHTIQAYSLLTLHMSGLFSSNPTHSMHIHFKPCSCWAYSLISLNSPGIATVNPARGRSILPRLAKICSNVYTNIRIQMSLIKEIYFLNKEVMVRGYPKFYISLSKNLTPVILVFQ
jgi:hypothetical protein